MDTPTVGDERQATNVGTSLIFPYDHAKNAYNFSRVPVVQPC